ncbi:hypothetical protein ACLX1H_003307 [Fusarium chlamydosporum]
MLTISDFYPQPSKLSECLHLLEFIQKNPGKPHWPPLDLDGETRALYEKAVADPSSLSDEERRTILLRPPREEEDSLCHDICGSTMSEIVTKALCDPDSLSYTEARLIASGVLSIRNSVMQQHSLRLRVKSDSDLRHEALTAATTKDEIAALEPCRAIQDANRKARDAAREALDGHDGQLIKRAAFRPHRGPLSWQEHIMSSSSSSKKVAPCGFVVFSLKQEDVKYSDFQQQLESCISHGFHYCWGLTEEPVFTGFKLHKIQHDSSESLQKRFITVRDAEGIPAGLRKDMFLYVDDVAVESLNSPRPFIWLWEPQEDLETQEHLGPVKIDTKHVAPLLLARLTSRDMSVERRIMELWRCGPELEGLLEAAKKSTNESREHDGIWPPRGLCF